LSTGMTFDYIEDMSTNMLTLTQSKLR